MAAARGCGSAVVHLVGAGADPGLVLSGGATVLHMSADMGLAEVGTDSCAMDGQGCASRSLARIGSGTLM